MFTSEGEVVSEGGNVCDDAEAKACSLSLRQLRGEARSSVVEASADAASHGGGGGPVQINYNFNFDNSGWHSKFPHPAQGKKVVPGTCSTFGCKKSFDLSLISQACQCYPGCDKTPFGNVCCHDFAQVCEKPGDALAKYTKYANANCFSGHGAMNLHDPDKPIFVQSVEQCSVECGKVGTCTGFVMQDYYLCYLRKHISIPHCAVAKGDEEHFDTYATDVERQDVEMPAPVPAKPGQHTYKRHRDWNCFEGMGAHDLGDPRWGSSVHECADYCDKDCKCTCFVFNHEIGTCYKRYGCQPGPRCADGAGAFDTYTRV